MADDALRCRLKKREKEARNEYEYVKAKYECRDAAKSGEVKVEWMHIKGASSPCFLSFIRTTPIDARKSGFGSMALFREAGYMLNRRCTEIFGIPIATAEGYWQRIDPSAKAGKTLTVKLKR